MAILMLINLKGGVAKTTSAVAIAECLASQGHRTLLIDADHQCMAGELLLGADGQLAAEGKRQTFYDLLAAMLDDDFASARFPRFVADKVSDIGGGLEKLSVMPCSVRMDDFQTNMAKAKRGYHSNDEFLQAFRTRKKQLRRWLARTYDFTVIDCPPSLALQVRVLLSVADGYIVPCIPDRLSVRGSECLLDRLRSHGYRAAPIGTLWSLYREQNGMHKATVAQAAERLGRYVLLPEPFKTVIPNAAKIAQSTEPGQHPASFGQKYSPEFATRFKNLCGEIIQRVEWQQDAVRASALVDAK